MTFGEILGDLLSDRDMTQKQLAEELNLGASTLSNYVQNTREPDYTTIKLLADYFDVSTDYLLNHRTSKAKTRNHKEDVLFRIFRELPPDQQVLFIKQGKVILEHCRKRDGNPEVKVADKGEENKK